MSATDLRLVPTKTPGVYKRAGRYVVTFTDMRGQRRKQFAKTYKEATRLKAQLKTDVERGEWSEQSRALFTDYACEWVSTYKGRTSRGIRPQTLSDYAGLLGLEYDVESSAWRPCDPPRAAVKFFGRRRLAEIAPPDVKQYAAWLASENRLEPSSVRKTIAPLRALLATAMEDGLIRSNPAAGVRIATPAPEGEDADAVKVKALTREQVDALAAATPGEWRLLVIFIAETGLRIGEAIALQWRHIDFGRRRVLVRRRYYKGSFGPPKSRFGRRDVPISTDLAQALWRVRSGDEDAIVFTTPTGRMIDTHNLRRRVLKPAAADAGLGEWIKIRDGQRAESWVGFHTLRHSCATALFERGFNAKQVQVWLGHHAPSFTLDTYVHLLSDDLPESPFGGDGVGDEWATRANERERNAEPIEASEVAV